MQVLITISHEIGWKERLQNHLFGIQRDVNLKSIKSSR